MARSASSLGGVSGAAQSSRCAQDYRPTAAWDEGFFPDGTPRPAYEGLLNALADVDLDELERSAAASMRNASVVFGDDEPFRLDPVPRLIEAEEWDVVARGLEQRARALGAFLADAYGDRAIVAAGRLPARVIDSSENFEPLMLGVSLPLSGCVAGLDLVRCADGRLRVLEDNMRTPSGMAYMEAARGALDRKIPWEPPGGLCDPEEAYDLLAAALRAAAPGDAGDPSIALLSDGPVNSAWWEHRRVAERLGIPIVSPRELFVRRGRLHARLESGGTRELQVVYRRTDEDGLRDGDGRATWLVEALLAPCRRGTLAVVNPLGAGLADDKLVHAYVEEMVRFYLDEEPLVASVGTYDLGDPEVLDAQLPRLGELVVKPRCGHGGAGVVVGPHATKEDRQLVERQVRARPGAWIAQELETLSTHPTLCGGRLEPRHVDLRPFVIRADHGARAAPGGLTRVAFDPGSLVVNSSQNGGGKDTWVQP